MVQVRMLLMTAYGGGLRVSELVRLLPTDIHSERMLIRVDQGRGRKDRYTLLSPRLLEELRAYWRQYRPQHWPFAGAKPGRHLVAGSAGKAFDLLANCVKAKLLVRCRRMLGAALRRPQEHGPRTAAEWMRHVLGVDVTRCPCCGGRWSGNRCRSRVRRPTRATPPSRTRSSRHGIVPERKSAKSQCDCHNPALTYS
jgi:integrase